MIVARATRLTVIFAALSGIYAAAFILPNSVGARDVNMIAVFNLDESVMYAAVRHMLQGGRTLAQVVGHFLVPGFWSYGYAFFLTSAVPLLPLRLFADPYNSLPFMLVLRELSPLFLAAAIALLCVMQTRGQSVAWAVVLFVFLALSPAVVNMSMWWHPDAPAVLFVVLTLFALDRDNLRFGRWYYAAAAFCGLATGTKVIGVWFFLAIPVYLAMGFRTLGLAGVVRHAAGFVAAMLAAIVVSTPLLVWPPYARQIISANAAAVSIVHEGRLMHTPGGLAGWSSTVRDGFGGWWIVAVAMAACVLTIARDPERRRLNILILAWSVPLSLWFIFAAGYKAERYLLPTLLPLFACLGAPRRSAIVAGAAMLVMLAQSAVNVRADAHNYQTMVTRERNSESLAFYRRLEAQPDFRRVSAPGLRVFRDPYVYFPNAANIDAQYVWRSATYEDVKAAHPDLIVLQQDYITLYSAASMASIATDPDEANASRPLYSDAKQDRIAGYHRILETPFASAFVRNGRVDN